MLIPVVLLLLSIVVAVVIVPLDELLLLHFVLLLRLVAVDTRIAILRLCKFLLLLSRLILLHLLLQMHVGCLLFGQVLLYLLDFTRLDSWFPAVIRRGGSLPTVDLWRTERSHVTRGAAELHVHFLLRRVLLSSLEAFVRGASGSLPTCA